MRVMRVVLSLNIVLSALASCFVGHTAMAANPNAGIVISEISMGSAESASDEFVELYNNTDQDVSLDGFSLYYKSSTGKTWTRRASLTTGMIIKAHDYFLLASTRPTAEATMSSGMAQTSGIIKIKDNLGADIDLVGYGSADTFETQAAASAQAGEVLYRNFDTDTQTMQDSDNNFDDFNLSSTETVKSAPAIETVAVEVSQTYVRIFLNELLPNPASPLEDSSDEFIELYNPNNSTVDLNGWILKDAGGTSFIIKDKVIAPFGYLVITSTENSLSLNNTGDIIYLYSPDSNLVDASADYGDAKEGLSWAVVGENWDWTVSPTPGAANSPIYIESDTAKAAASKTTKKTTAAKKAKAAAKPKTSKAKTAAQNAAGKNDPANVANSANSNSMVWSWLLIALGVGTIGYGIYEYRPEINSAYHRLISKYKARK